MSDAKRDFADAPNPWVKTTARLRRVLKKLVGPLYRASTSETIMEDEAQELLDMVNEALEDSK